jgi:regulator of nonsense transcripts 3
VVENSWKLTDRTMTLSVASKSEGEKKSATATSGNKAKVEENQSKKIVIRRLPPTLTKEQFLDIVSPLPEYDFFYYCDADTRCAIFIALDK